MGIDTSTVNDTTYFYDNYFAKSIDITVKNENSNCDSDKKILTQFEDKDQINNFNVTIYN